MATYTTDIASAVPSTTGSTSNYAVTISFSGSPAISNQANTILASSWTSRGIVDNDGNFLGTVAVANTSTSFTADGETYYAWAFAYRLRNSTATPPTVSGGQFTNAGTVGILLTRTATWGSGTKIWSSPQKVLGGSTVTDSFDTGSSGGADLAWFEVDTTPTGTIDHQYVSSIDDQGILSGPGIDGERVAADFVTAIDNVETHNSRLALQGSDSAYSPATRRELQYTGSIIASGKAGYGTSVFSSFVDAQGASEATEVGTEMGGVGILTEGVYMAFKVRLNGTMHIQTSDNWYPGNVWEVNKITGGVTQLVNQYTTTQSTSFSVKAHDYVYQCGPFISGVSSGSFTGAVMRFGWNGFTAVDWPDLRYVSGIDNQGILKKVPLYGLAANPGEIDAVELAGYLTELNGVPAAAHGLNDPLNYAGSSSWTPTEGA